MVTPASFLTQNTANYEMMNDNLQSYKCGQKTGVEFCNGTYSEQAVYDNNGRYVRPDYFCQGHG